MEIAWFGLHFPQLWRAPLTRWSVLGCVLACTVAPPAAAQNRNAGEIRGVVQDATGGAVPDVSVDARNVDTGVVTHAETNSSGLYDMPFVVAGNYTLTFNKAGFGEVTEQNITLHTESITVNGTLAVGAVEVRVDVSASSDLLQTEDAEINLTLAPAQLTELPDVGGDWRTYTELLPGVGAGRYNVGPGGGLASGAYVTLNGGQSTQMQYLLDGGVAITPQAGDPLNTNPPLDAIAEVNIQTGVFGAEFGNGTSIFNVITKAGTRQFHGAVFERIQNDYFNARPFSPFSASTPNGKLRWNQYGAAIGGPLWKDRVFGFGAFQRNPSIVPVNTILSVPTLAERMGLLSGATPIYDPATGNQTRTAFPTNANGQFVIPQNRLDPVAQKILSLFPLPTPGLNAGADSNNYLFKDQTPNYLAQYSARFDLDLSPNHRIYTSGLFSPNSYTNPAAAVPSRYFSYVQDVKTWNGQITDAYSITSSLLNEARGAVSHGNEAWSTPDTGGASKIGLPDAPFDVFPHINISSQFIGINSDLFGYIDDTTYSLADSISWTRGRHTIKAGGEWDRTTAESNFYQITAGNFQFTGAATSDPSNSNPTGLGFADFLLGAVDNWNIYVPARTRTASQNRQFYIADNYKFSSSLTLNYGVRVLHQGGFDEIHNRFSNFQPDVVNPDPTLPAGTLGAVGFAGAQIPTTLEKGKFFVQPRFGFAWGFRPGWSARGGFGLYNIPWTVNNYTNGLGNGYALQNAANPPTNSYQPVFQLASGAPPPLALDRTPAAFNGQNIGYQPYDTPIAYLSEYQLDVQHEVHGYLIDVAYVGTKGTHIGFNSQLTQIHVGQLGSSTHPYPQYAGINATLNNGTSHYDSLQVQSKKQLSSGLAYTLAYTWSKNLDTGTGQGGFGTGQEISQDAYDPGANYGPSINDLRHTFNGSLVYELPFGHDRRYLRNSGVVDLVAGGWQVTSAFQYHSGTPFTPYVASNDQSGRFSGGVWFPNRMGSGKVAQRTLHQWYNPNDYVVPARNTFGDARRNSQFGPVFGQIDLSGGKRFPLTKINERTYFELKADAFNATNHPNWGTPNPAIYGNPTDNAKNSAGAISSFFAMRLMQFSGTIRF